MTFESSTASSWRSRKDDLVSALSLPDFLILATLILFVFRFLTGFVGFGLLGIASAGLYASMRIELVKAVVRDQPIISGLFFLCALVAMFHGPETAWRSAYYAATGGACILAAYTLSNGRVDALLVARVLLFGFFASVIVLVPFKGISPENFNDYFPNSSRNGISGNLIFLQVFYSVAFYLRHKRAPLVTPVATLVLCVFLYGRSGTLFAAGLVLVSCIQAMRPRRHLALSACAATIVIMALVLSPTLKFIDLPDETAPEIISTEVQHSEGSDPVGSTVDTASDPGVSEWRRGLETIRTTMLREYIEGMTPLEFMLGRNMASAPTIAEYHLNAHNAYIRGHSYFGAAYLALIIGILGLAAWNAYKTGGWFILALMGVFAARAFLDAFALFDLFDVGFFFAAFSLARLADQDRGQKEQHEPGENAQGNHKP